MEAETTTYAEYKRISEEDFEDPEES